MTEGTQGIILFFDTLVPDWAKFLFVAGSLFCAGWFTWDKIIRK